MEKNILASSQKVSNTILAVYLVCLIIDLTLFIALEEIESACLYDICHRGRRIWG